ncbi:glycosyltransferase [Silvimonas iriomotensis]|uniref:Glycosyltransferase WbpZ n=1 Tax=Silvimonas iriomotensis TaxID=449662 RepID=A0ABQ2PE89_9NEIS|nr:glycosyltransferase [Silvimonas iriomotensis]GGP23631.1 glycosyltransferase WbpZ [Silvimonas iriomotensis]
MKVLHVYKTYYPDTVGGVEQVIRGLAMGGRAQGVAADVLVLSAAVKHPETLVIDGVTVHRYPTTVDVASTPFSAREARDFGRFIAPYDVLHYHFPWPFGDVLHALAGHRKPSVVTYHSDIVKQKWLKKAYSPLMNWFLGHVDAIAPTSPGYLASSVDLVPFRDKCTVIPLGLDPASHPAPDPQAVAAYRERFGERYFAFVGVFRYYKGLQYLIEAASHVAENIVLMGDGPLRGEYEAEAARRGLTNLHFIGLVDEQVKMDILAGAHAFVFPSHLRSEAFGLGLAEAAMMGKPMISCDIGTGTSFINLHGETGLVIPPADPSALAQAMNTLSSDVELATRQGEAARRRFGQMFSLDKMVSAYTALYRRVLAGSKR